MKKISRSARSILLLLLAMCSFSVNATEPFVCVTSATTLATQFKAWDGAGSGHNLYLRLVQGIYLLNTDIYAVSDGASIKIEGGWNSDCSLRSNDPGLTRISGTDDAHRPTAGDFRLVSKGSSYPGDGDIEITNLTMDRFTFVNLSILSPVSQITLHRIIYRQSDQFALTVNGSALVENNLFTANTSAGAALSVLTIGPDANSYVMNNTIVNNNADGLEFQFDDSSEGIVGVANDIIWGNVRKDGAPTFDILGPGSDPVFASSGNVSVIASDYHTPTGNFQQSSRLDIDPAFTDAGNGDFSLRYDPTHPELKSPLINAGLNSPPNDAYGTESNDLLGQTRVVGSRIDLGALESRFDDRTPLPVLVSHDNTSEATLRAAIIAANAASGPSLISFNIPNAPTGSCPPPIVLTSLLPDIVSDVTIDGITQPNSGVEPFGVPCIVIRAPSGGMNHALKTVNGGRLTVRGIEFEGFGAVSQFNCTGAAIYLAGSHSTGPGDTVLSNTFSTFAGSAPNYCGLAIDANVSKSVIGTPSEPNMFDQSEFAAIYATHNVFSGAADRNVISGNYMGLAGGNGRGIYLDNSGYFDISRNTIGASAHDALAIEGTGGHDNFIHSNSLGASTIPFIGATVASNADSGLRIYGGAHDNLIGLDGGNTIVGNGKPGIWIQDTGIDNRVIGSNVVYDNGNGSGGRGLSIDLGALGPNFDDPGDTDSGANNLENYATLTHAFRIGPNRVSVSAAVKTNHPAPSGESGVYRMDVFWTDACVPSIDGARGEMKQYIGYFLVSTPLGLDINSGNYVLYASGNIPTSGYLFATATDNQAFAQSAPGNTSEPGPCAAMFNDYIFSDSLEK